MADNNDDDDDFLQQPHPMDDYGVHQQIQKREHLAEDYDTPFSEPNDADEELPDEHSLHDERAESQEWYDEGDDDAAVDTLSANVQSNNPAILGYDPAKDERRKKK